MTDELLSRALDQAGDAIVVVDREGVVPAFNQIAQSSGAATTP